MQKSWSGSMVPTHLTSPIVDGTDETFQVAVTMGILVDAPTIREMAFKIDNLIQS